MKTNNMKTKKQNTNNLNNNLSLKNNPKNELKLENEDNNVEKQIENAANAENAANDVENIGKNELVEVESQTEPNPKSNMNSAKQISLNRLCMNLLNHQIVMKLYHFQTKIYGAHKASDAYISKYADTLDRFLEVAQGIYGKVTLKKYSLAGSSHTDDNIIKHINGMISYWRTKINDVLDNYTDLINIRDELVADAEQLKYLLSFK